LFQSDSASRQFPDDLRQLSVQIPTHRIIAWSRGEPG
jgi:hypothetical protein